MNRKISEEDYLKIRKNIIKKLYSQKSFCKGHLLFETLQSGIPSHLKGYVKLVLADLINENLVRYYGKTINGDAFQLNPDKLKEIEHIILP